MIGRSAIQCHAPRIFLVVLLGSALVCCSADRVESPSSRPQRSAADTVGPHPSSPICEAVKLDDPARVLQLLTNGSNPNVVCQGDNGGAQQPLLSVAAEKGRLDIVKLLLGAGARAAAGNTAGYTALHMAAIRGYIGVAGELLRAGAPVNARTSDGITPLHSGTGSSFATTSCETRAAMVRLLLSAGANPNAADRFKMTVLHDAAQRGCSEVVTMLIQAGSDVDAVEDYSGRTPLLMALGGRCSQPAVQEIVTILLNAGANPLLANRQRDNAVAIASTCRDREVYRIVSDRARLFLPGESDLR